MKQKELVRKIKKVIAGGLTVDRRKYEVWETYWYKIIEDLVILQIPWLWSKGKKTRYTDRVFNSILKDLWSEESVEVLTFELGWEDSLRWLFNHYKYWKDDSSNSICINSSWQIIGVQYNGLKTTTIIKSLGCPITKDYIVVNWNIKLKWKYNISDSKELIDYIGLYFNNK